ncbi:MAG: hypothetical protein KZQ99_10030 [Candidatus Thiodiazotropha sp. (ex Dulcina madagascariensis)]|nr:hypothetical protein [Candidatus Thiodiazotropha sp. (ex Dulcina madagascariensis)]
MSGYLGSGLGTGSGSGPVFSVEEFVQSLTAQLDRAQDALAIKAKTGRPLTFALKDLSVDLKVFWEAPEGQLRLRHANPNEEGASTVHLSFTTITRAMAEENSLSLSQDEDPRALSEITEQGGLGEQERRQLEMVGIRTVGQFKRLSQNTDPKQVEAYLGIPVNRLRMALERSAQPAVTGNEPVQGADKRRLLRIRGANLMKGETPRVLMSGEPVEVLEASASELLVKPMSHHREGRFEVEVGGQMTGGFYELPTEPNADPFAVRQPVRRVGGIKSW